MGGLYRHLRAFSYKLNLINFKVGGKANVS